MISIFLFVFLSTLSFANYSKKIDLKVKPVRFETILISVNSIYFEAYITLLEDLSKEKTRILVVLPEQSRTPLRSGFGELVDDKKMWFSLLLGGEQLVFIIDWDTAENMIPGYIAKLTIKHPTSNNISIGTATLVNEAATLEKNKP